MDRIIARWRIPHGENDFTRYLAFDEPTGMSVIAMASGHLWIADPIASPLETADPFSAASSVCIVADLDSRGRVLKNLLPALQTLCPDPAWPSSHPTPWLRAVTDNRIWDEDLANTPRWTASVAEFYPDKNRPDCFGGATWFVNEALHIRGTAEVFMFTIPQLSRYPVTELLRLGERVLVIERHMGKGVHEAWVLSADSTVESVKAHLQIGGTIAQLQKTKLAVDELPTRRYALWRHRVEPSKQLHL
ncbi:hypothetical protein FS837_004175 [Tulasnella sp. UAMH 9824]|nr:hypothetical protein FS837_004175 [Tulasnella sp. UAMH 9824]